MDDCIFCRILAGDAPGTFLYRDTLCAAFMDTRPVNTGHVLIVPLHHAQRLAELTEDTAGHLMRVAHRLAAAIRASGLRCEGINVFLADGAAAGQEIFHTHVHVFPRYGQDGFGLRFGAHYSELPARGDLEQAAARIRASLTGSIAPAV